MQLRILGSSRQSFRSPINLSECNSSNLIIKVKVNIPHWCASIGSIFSWQWIKVFSSILKPFVRLLVSIHQCVLAYFPSLDYSVQSRHMHIRFRLPTSEVHDLSSPAICLSRPPHFTELRRRFRYIHQGKSRISWWKGRFCIIELLVHYKVKPESLHCIIVLCIAHKRCCSQFSARLYHFR